MSYREHTSLYTTTTTSMSANSEATEKGYMTDLSTDVGAPFELYIKQKGNVGYSTAKYTTPASDGALADNKISPIEATSMANNIHRILKYYLATNYVVDKISEVRLNVVFKE